MDFLEVGEDLVVDARVLDAPDEREQLVGEFTVTRGVGAAAELHVHQPL